MGKLGTKHGVRNIYPIKGGSRWVYKWRVTDQNGSETLTSRSFSTRDAAADFKKKKDHEIRKQGSIHSLGSKDMRDAVDAMLILLAHKGISLSDAAAYYVKHNPLDATVTVEDAVEKYLQYRKPSSLSDLVDVEAEFTRYFFWLSD